MSIISVKNINNETIDVNVIRYFKYKNTKYFIYTFDEIDERGFIKLYIVKIMKQFDDWIAKTIIDENEWKHLQQIIKEIIKQLKDEEYDNIFDLDVNEIRNIKIKEARYFKLDKRLMDILIQKNEINNENEILNNLPNMQEILPIEIRKNCANDNLNIDYKKLYFELKKDNEELNEIMSDMLLELSEYHYKYGVLKGK